jgi:hypothetical protein
MHGTGKSQHHLFAQDVYHNITIINIIYQPKALIHSTYTYASAADFVGDLMIFQGVGFFKRWSSRPATHYQVDLTPDEHTHYQVDLTMTTPEKVRLSSLLMNKHTNR